MTWVLAYAFVAVLLGWVVYALAGIVMSVPVALIAGGLIGAFSVVFLRDTVLIRGLLAVLGPIGVVLPLLALRHMAAGVGVAVMPFGTVELLVFLLAYTMFLAASMGVVPVDLYRFGYAPLPVGFMVLVLCAYGMLSGNVFIPVLAVLGQLLWILGWGSSNWFDHVLHALLVPIVLVVVIGRVF